MSTKLNSRSHKSRIRQTRLMFLIAASFLVASAVTSHVFSASNNFFGAIYTSLNDGSAVNQNLYDAKPAVYLNGGPQNLNGSGLPDGTYYFQVTNPSGSVLLSTDPAACRQLNVANGVVSGAAGPCPHANGVFNPSNNSTPVQLSPFLDTPNNGGEYKVWLIRQTSTTSIVGDPVTSAILSFQSKDAKTDNFKVKEEECTDCGGNTSTTLSGRKFYDANVNSIDDAEVGVENVRIVVTIDDVEQPFVETDAQGGWTFENVPVGSTYKVCETLPLTGSEPADYWVQTAPAPDSQGAQCYSGTVSNDDPITGLDFGDVCFHPAQGGKTLGFWSNKNGQAIMKSNDNFVGDFTFLNALNLKNYNGSNFDILPVTGGANAYTKTFRAWLLNGNAVNMAYMLSVQLSATSLDVRHGLLSDGQIVDATSLGLGYITIGSVRAAANAELNAVGGNLTFTGNPLRQDQEILKDFLDSVNNNLLPFASATPCAVVYPEIQTEPLP